MHPRDASHVLAGRYRLERILGEGGMGIVYAGFDQTIERSVAVKLLSRDAGTTPEDVQRLLREVKATAQVNNAHVVTLLDAGETEDGDPFLVMELLDGESLSTVLRRENRLPVARAVAIALQVCDGLGAAHAVGLVHRDVKPGNVMLSKGLGAEHATLLDFGIAKGIDRTSTLTQAGALIGTLEYMAPEQIAGEALDGRADQYALAATVLVMVAGEPLFPGVSIASLVHHHLLTVPRPLHERVPDVPLALDQVLRRALEKKPSARYSDIAAFASALASAVGSPHSQGLPALVDAPTELHPQPSSRIREVELEELGPGATLELAEPLVMPSRTASSPKPDLPLAVTRELVAADKRADQQATLLVWLSPEVWKRVLAYSMFVLLLGNGCVRGFPTIANVLLAMTFALAVGALVVHAKLTSRDP